MDLKYDILKHPKVRETTDGSGEAYKHGEVTKSIASIEIVDVDMSTLTVHDGAASDYELLSDEEIEKLFE